MTTITIDRSVLVQALEALEQSETFVPYEGFGITRRKAESKHQAAIIALRAALAQEQAGPAQLLPCPTPKMCEQHCCGGWCGPRAEPAQEPAVTADMRSAVRFAPSSAYWSERLREFFGPDAREGIDALERRLAESDLSRCPQCDGPADNGHDRSIPPSPYLCTRCMAEPLNLSDRAVQKRLAAQWGYVPAEQAEPAQEPVAWLQPKTVDAHSRPDLGYETCSKDDYGAFPVHTAPPRRTMVPLTAQQLDGVIERHVGGSEITDDVYASMEQFARAIEKASWEKNHG